MGKTADLDAAQRSELGAFLRARRESLRPGDVGLRAPPTRRNTPGLRREEVAQVSGVGLTWYTWLEQGRPITTSAAVIDALAKTLRLGREGHAHLRHLAGLRVPESDQPPSVDGEFDALLGILLPAPACVLGPRFDFIAWNDAFATIWAPDTLPAERCNVMWMAFCDPERRGTWVNWEERSRTLLAEFRGEAGMHAGDPRFTELITELQDASTEFRSWWAGYEVGHSITGHLTIRTNQVGTIDLDVIELRVCSHPSLRLSVHTPTRHADTRKLLVLTSSRGIDATARLTRAG